MEQAQKSAVGPELLPDEIFRSIGCCALRDLGAMAWVRISCFHHEFSSFSYREFFPIAIFA
jgi:hypothetical protein